MGGGRTIWVKAAPDAPCGIVFRVESDTEIGERQPDHTLRERRFEDLEADQPVKVWAGAVAEGCPGRATAHAIEIELASFIG